MKYNCCIINAQYFYFRSTSVSSLSTRVISPIVSITATHNGKEIHRVNGSISFKVSDYNKVLIDVTMGILQCCCIGLI